MKHLVVSLILSSTSTVRTAVASGLSCLLLNKSECGKGAFSTSCVWNESPGACKSQSTSKDTNKWHGFMELGQTHVIRASGETRHAPRLIAERETELLFTPTLEEQPTLSPTLSPTATIVHNWGLEQDGDITTSPLNPEDDWPSGYPNDLSVLIDKKEDDNSQYNSATTYYTPNALPDVDIDFDLKSQRLFQGLYIQPWYVTRIQRIDVAIHPDQGEGPAPDVGSTSWKWLNNVGSVSSGLNQALVIKIPKIPGRYLKVRFHGGSSSHGKDWGIRIIKISGNKDGLVDDEPTNSEDGIVNGIAFIPPSTAEVRVAAYSSEGKLLGVIQARDPTNIRPILEQAVTKTPLDPYSTMAWSATLPWDWVKEGTEVIVGTAHNEVIHRLVLRNLAFWATHTLHRTKVLIFGTEEDVTDLDTSTRYETKRLLTGMFGSMPASQMKWVDTPDWHLPYLIQGTSAGPKLVHNEMERVAALEDAGDDPKQFGSNNGKFPGWDILKHQLVFRHTNANSGTGLAHTDGDGGSPYASGTSIFMGWSLSDYKEKNKEWFWRKMGPWSGWGGAGWVGWTAIPPGDECGNLLIHEVGHSQTMSHFTSGTAEKWGIADEYPQDGTNLKTHPWGYDTYSRRFRTWYYPPNGAGNPPNSDGLGKKDPMNSGKYVTSESCFPQYTAYHAKKSQNWARSSPVLIPAGVSGVSADGAYQYDFSTQKYKRISDSDISKSVDKYAMPPDEVGIPVVTLIGTLGDSNEVCQTYPPLRSSEGNTFKFPSPTDPNLSEEFNNAAHFIEIEFEDGSSERALIAVPNLAGSKKLRYFSVNIAARRRPSAIKLYQFDNDSYPNITPQSSSTLMHTREISLPPKASGLLKGLPAVLRIGGGWLGDSGDVKITQICTDCRNELQWRGMEGLNLIYDPVSLDPAESLSEATLFRVPVVREEDESLHHISVMASRFIGLEGTSYPLVNPLPPKEVSSASSPDMTYGIRFWAPLEKNYLQGGTYKSKEDALTFRILNQNGDVLSNVRLSIEFTKTTDRPSTFPSSAPSPFPVEDYWGLEKFGTLEVDPANPTMGWPENYPKNKYDLLDSAGPSTYYLPLDRPDIDIKFDLEKSRHLKTVWLKIWYLTRIPSIDVGTHPNDGSSEEGLQPDAGSSGWTWTEPITVLGGSNKIITFEMPPDTFVRYVKIRLRGGYTDHDPIKSWGIRQIQMFGSSDVQESPNESSSPSTFPTSIPSIVPSSLPSLGPSSLPSVKPTMLPSNTPSFIPSQHPSISPSLSPSQSPSLSPSQSPSLSPSQSPSLSPSQSPSLSPSQSPSLVPSQSPSLSPSQSPTLTPSNTPSGNPTSNDPELIHVDFSNKFVYTSREFTTPRSSLYFVATDPFVGPTTPIWYGGSKEALYVRMTSSCGDITMNVKAQQTGCGRTWQMNGARTKKRVCRHSLKLYMYTSFQRRDKKWRGCTLTSIEPVVIEARRYHRPNSNKLLGTLKFMMSVTI